MYDWVQHSNKKPFFEYQISASSWKTVWNLKQYKKVEKKDVWDIFVK